MHLRFADAQRARSVSNKLFLDNLGKFTSTPPKDLPIYEMGGGILNLSQGVKGDITSGKISLIYNAAEPGWYAKVRKLGFDEESIAFISKIGDIVSSVVTIVGAAEAAVKVLEILDIIST